MHEITALTLPLSETKFFKLSNRPAAGAPCIDAIFRTPAAGKPKKKGAVAKAKPKPQLANANAGVVTDVEMSDGQLRSAWLVDDILNAVYVTIENVKVPDIDFESIDQALCLALEWAFTGKVTTLSGKVQWATMLQLWCDLLLIEPRLSFVARHPEVQETTPVDKTNPPVRDSFYNRHRVFLDKVGIVL
jgi:hypothetical protein